jgi:uncharacterized protein (TIGR02265 family)
MRGSMSAPIVRRFRVTSGVKLKGSFDEEARILSVPAGVTTKGMYLADLAARAGGEEARAIWPKLREVPRNNHYLGFHDYPFADALRWLHAVARREYPNDSLLQGLRLIGRDTVRVFLASKVGRVVRGMVSGARPSLLRLPAMWQITDPWSRASAEPLDDGSVRFQVQRFPGWIDCGLIGTIEQVALNQGAKPVIDVELDGPMNGVFVVSGV